MARTPRKGPGSRAPRRRETEEQSSPAVAETPVISPPGTTGRFLVLMREDAAAAGPSMLNRVAGLTVASTADFEAGAPTEDLGGAEALMLTELGVAVVDAPPDQIRALGVAADSGILAIEPERVVYAIQDEPVPGLPGIPAPRSAGFPLDYLKGYRDAVNHLYDALTGAAAPGALGAEAIPSFVEEELTWGLQATKVPASRFTGRGIRVAILDTGLDVGHPDFAGRSITTQSFIQGQQVQDGHGHGTHCTGTACGPRRPGRLPRYGIAYEAEIFAGKVLSNQGSGADAGILAGIQWGLTNGCAILSMSLGSPVEPGQSFSRVYENVARRALARGTVIIAAAGNESERPGLIAPVGHPANCPSIMAVGALDREFKVAWFSCGGLNPDGGQVDIAGPGVDIHSSWPRPTLYKSISGTSMATPHVAGIAALWAECDAQFRGRALMSILTQSARRLARPARDVGAGLVQAP
jgi:subtilisin family serine protease